MNKIQIGILTVAIVVVAALVSTQSWHRYASDADQWSQWKS